MTRLMLRIVFVVCAVLLAGCVAQPIFPGDDWSVVADPATAGFDAGALGELAAATEAGNTQSMIVIKGGEVVYSFGDIALSEDAYVASVRKSILSMMYGDWVQRGIIDLDATLEMLHIDDLQGLSEREKTATLRHLISARSGVYHPASNFSGVTEDGPRRGDHGPGEYYWYNNWDFNAAGGIFEQLTGGNIYEAFDEQLSKPLGLQDFDLATHLDDGKTGNLKRSKFPAYHFFLSARDLARLGLLMLRGGEWNDEQIIPADWIIENTAIVTPNAQMNPPKTRDTGFGYGYMWWVFDPDRFPNEYLGGYAARGHFGQYIIVLPAMDLVIAHKTLGEDYETPEEYEAINVTWDEMRVLVDLVLAAM